MSFGKFFKNRIVIVFGASSGIGAHTADELIKFGAKVIVVSRNSDILNSIYKNRPVTILAGDITQSNDTSMIIKQIENRFGHLDHIIISSGTFQPSSLDNPSENELCWDNVIGTNLKGVYFFIKNSLHLLKGGKGKSIVILSSLLSHFGGLGTTCYAASKAGVTAMIKCLCLELAKYKIRINGVSPGHVDTPMISDMLNKDHDSICQLYPLNRIARVDDISPLIFFLLCDLSSWVTGCDYIIDGGRSASV